MVSQERARATRERIVRGAAETFDRDGFASSSLADIAAASGVTKGALYFHFASKDDIAAAVIEAEHAIASASARVTIAETASPLECAVILSADLARRLQSDPIVRAGIRLTTESSSSEISVREPYEDWLETFETVARAAVAAGELRPDVDPVQLARFIIPSYTGMQLVSEVFSGRADLPARVREMWGYLFRAVVPADQLDAALAMAARHLPGTITG